MLLSGLIEEGIDDPDNNGTNLPLEFTLNGNYPNPFNTSTVIQYSLPRISDITITIYNILGQRVAAFVIEEQAAGIHQIIWDAKDKPSGMYFYRLKADDFTATKMMLLLK